MFDTTSKSNPHKDAEHITLKDDTESSSSSEGVSNGDSKTECDDHTHLVLQTPLVTSTKNLETGLVSSSPQDLSTRRAMVSIIEDDTNFDFSFLSSLLSQPVSSSCMPSGLELATAKAFLRNFMNMNLSNLGTIEKAIVLSTASILKSSPKFSQSSAFVILDTLNSMFMYFQYSSSTCSETLIRVGNFKAQKEKLDDMFFERKSLLSTLQEKNKDFDPKEELVKKLEIELAQHKADMMVLLHDSEVLKASSNELKYCIQSLGDELMNQREAYQLWEDTLKKAEANRADCYSKWEDLRRLDLY